ncbi:hypothetical protein A9G34_04255 [Gilliamella sp. Choc4-2]|uniref:hypothetical protein n=1 Tax=unclassified Gilliamella TaxID=2685620 RepID=UPI00080E60DA|nr:hypothetical protein [Gilliamella apicola]OCG32735.1 hypothetical protein A9G33_02855 [Gilliamella apicola]OCG46735.1 hypothetical protein A9G34_04255 [Gilliamella apicola]OCG56493.1 hypothetical protein A9G36_00280 [Gilliamella apicola]
MKLLKYLSILLFISFLFGCGNNKYDTPKNTYTQVNGLTKEQVKAAILASATKEPSRFSNWKMTVADKNTIRATLVNREYQVVVNIPYSAEGYAINFVSGSTNLTNNKGQIHRNYKRWIKKLDNNIKLNLAKAK